MELLTVYIHIGGVCDIQWVSRLYNLYKNNFFTCMCKEGKLLRQTITLFTCMCKEGNGLSEQLRISTG